MKGKKEMKQPRIFGVLRHAFLSGTILDSLTRKMEKHRMPRYIRVDGIEIPFHDWEKVLRRCRKRRFKKLFFPGFIMATILLSCPPTVPLIKLALVVATIFLTSEILAIKDACVYFAGQKSNYLIEVFHDQEGGHHESEIPKENPKSRKK